MGLIGKMILVPLYKKIPWIIIPIFSTPSLWALIKVYASTYPIHILGYINIILVFICGVIFPCACTIAHYRGLINMQHISTEDADNEDSKISLIETFIWIAIFLIVFSLIIYTMFIAIGTCKYPEDFIEYFCSIN